MPTWWSPERGSSSIVSRQVISSGLLSVTKARRKADKPQARACGFLFGLRLPDHPGNRSAAQRAVAPADVLKKAFLSAVDAARQNGMLKRAVVSCAGINVIMMLLQVRADS